MNSVPSDIACTIAAHGLAGTLLDFPTETIAPARWNRLLREIVAQRLTGHLAQAALDGALALTDCQLDEALTQHQAAVCTALLNEQMTLDMDELLESAGIDVIVLKGAAVAHLDYPDASLRGFGDTDLLVRSEQFDEAARVLGGAGLVRQYPEPRPGFDRRFSKGAPFISKNGLEVDLHRTFVMGPFGLTVDLEELWSSAITVGIGGRTLRALGDDGRFMHACYHSVLGGSLDRLVPQRDVAQMALLGNVSRDRLLALARAWQAEPVIASAIRLTWETFDLADATALSAWALHYDIDARGQRMLAAYGDGHDYRNMSIAAVSALPRFRDKAAFLTALAVPGRSYLQSRHRTRRDHLLHGLTKRSVSPQRLTEQ